MAKAKHQKVKSDRLSHRKKRGTETDVSELRAQLDLLGLKIIQVTADGNCFFRALADQLEGNEDEHEKYRNMVVRFIKNNREMFEPFVEDEVPFDEYCRSMGQEGNWAGHMELQAASLATHSNICVHRNRSPRLYAQNFDVLEAPQIHLSYHDGEHYNSVRLKDDTCSGPARPIFITGDAGFSAKPNEADVVTVPEREGGENFLQEKFSNILNAASGYEQKAEQALNAGGDIVAEVLSAEQESRVHMVAANEPLDSAVDTPYDEHQDMNFERESSNGAERVCNMISLPPDEKKNSNTKACSYGLKKKYKSFRGLVAGKPCAGFPVGSNQTVNYRKSWTDRKPGRKGASTVANSSQPNGRSPDMGSLCI